VAGPASPRGAVGRRARPAHAGVILSARSGRFRGMLDRTGGRGAGAVQTGRPEVWGWGGPRERGGGPLTGRRRCSDVITELAVERVAFTCGACGHRWSVDYDVQRYLDGHGDEWEYFHRDNTVVPSPYVPENAPACARCGHRETGRLVARRP